LGVFVAEIDWLRLHVFNGKLVWEVKNLKIIFIKLFLVFWGSSWHLAPLQDAYITCSSRKARPVKGIHARACGFMEHPAGSPGHLRIQSQTTTLGLHLLKE
jgi:hypothetical protein